MQQAIHATRIPHRKRAFRIECFALPLLLVGGLSLAPGVHGQTAPTYKDSRSLAGNPLTGDPLNSHSLTDRSSDTVGRGELLEALRLDNQRRRNLRRLIGNGRWRQLREAHYLMDRYDNDPTTNLFERREDYERVRRTLEKGALNAVAELAEVRLGLDDLAFRKRHEERRQERKNRSNEGFDVSVSPRARIGSDPGLGVRMRLKTDRDLWSRFSFIVNKRFESEELSTSIRWHKGDTKLQLSHTLNDRHSSRYSTSPGAGRDRVISFSIEFTR